MQILCGTCKTELDIIEANLDSLYDLEVKVEPRPECLKEAMDNGLEEAYNEGHEAGHGEGFQKGYDDGLAAESH